MILSRVVKTSRRIRVRQLLSLNTTYNRRCCTNRQDEELLLKRVYEEDRVSGAQLGGA